ncbi:MAG TPA: peptidoglycan bridge formation glycyltransferase FemA/FemB family protein [Bacteroidia bacterium]|jgi:aminoglycoside 3-N-acetyltransferase|nr:peptidoglycan bridge formation glycyltransferase FemA/FemB family protein [Bacteroidia bacterium]
MEIVSVDKLGEKNDYPYFYSKKYASFINSENKNVILFRDEIGNSIVCKIWKNKFLKLIQPIYPPLSDNAIRLNKQQESDFLNEWTTFIINNKIAHRIVPSENFGVFKSKPKYSISAPFGTYCLNLEESTEQELFRKIHAKHRNVIKNAEKNNVVLKYGKECIKDFYLLYEQTMKRSNMYCQDITYFENFYSLMPQNIICGVSYFNNIPQGGLFSPYTKFGAFYLFGASNKKIEINGAINYLHWNTIKLLKQQGVKRYDFVGARLSDISGTKLEGIQLFKKRFGGDLEKGFLWKKDIDVFDCFVFDELIRLTYTLKKETPLLDIIDEELLKNSTPHNVKFTSTKRIGIKMQEMKETFRKKIRRLRKVIKKNDLVKDLSLAGIQKGDTILVHSSLSKIGNVKNGTQTVINALMEQIGDKGNLVMPAYSYVDSMENTSQEKDYIFDPIISPSVVGKITEEFRKMPRVKRSIHPTHSVCAYGELADYITSGHIDAETNFGLNTPFHRVRELKGKIVGLGIGIGPVTIYHSAEDFFPELFLDVYLPKPETIKIRVDGSESTKSIFIHNPAFHSNRIDKNKFVENWLMNHFLKKGILHMGAFGSGIIWWMDIQELFDEQIALKQKGISIYRVPENE